MTWIGYANQQIHDQVAPVLTAIMQEKGLIGRPEQQGVETGRERDVAF
jgi:hypothetical protein